MNDEAKIEFYLNEGWNGKDWKPYDLLILGESIFATRRTARGHEHPDSPSDASEYREIVLAKARERWLKGFWADPFTPTPRRRK